MSHNDRLRTRKMRHYSVYDMDIESHARVSNYEETVQQLDVYYGIVKRQLLRYQHPITGIFPALSTDTKVASVRDSIYCAAAIWSLFQAYRRIDDDRGKSYELGQSAVKCMRGILECWIRQAARIELFKMKQCSDYALHSKFHLATGTEIFNDGEYSHLQIDVVSLYLIFLVQMIASGLQIIYTQDEVSFVQTLVYYVERAYRTPDFGMWERGSKYNDNTPEIHASSIGMAKSALEAINGCNLFGEKGAAWSVVYVDIDAHNRNRSIFETLLPRESCSKDVDASLLPTISFPAFATQEKILCDGTISNITRKLKGRYGFRRFPRDGYKTVLEDDNRRYYNIGETKEFENIENEWPLFFLFMIIDGVFKNNDEQVETYRQLLQNVIKYDKQGDPVVPMYYYVPKELIESEKAEYGSQTKLPSGEGSGDNQSLFLWNQALYVIAQLLIAGLLHVNELDPIRRFLPSYSKPRKTARYSAFQGAATDLVVQVVLIAESMRLQAMMGTYGIQTQTPHEVEPVQIWSSKQLEQVYKYLGVNKKLKLTGRPMRPVGSLGTSKIYRVCGMTVLCYPLIFEVSQFYLYRDMALLIDDIKTEIQFVCRYWRLSGRPTVCLVIREEHMRDPQFNKMVDLLAMFKKGYCDSVKVRIGRLQNLLSSSCIEHLDFMKLTDKSELKVQKFHQLVHEYIGYQSLTDVPKVMCYSEEQFDVSSYYRKETYEVLDAIRNSPGIYVKAQLFGIILQREGDQYDFNGETVKEHLQNLYFLAGSLQYWIAVRYCSSLLHHTVDSISPFITSVLVSGRLLTVGVIGHKETVFDKPMTPAEIHSVMYSTIQMYNIIHAVLQQEIILYCGRLVSTHTSMFKGILKIRVGWVLEAMRQYLIILGRPNEELENLSPSEIRQLLFKVLSVRDWSAEESITPLQRRQLEGCWCRVPNHFYEKVWDIMTRTPNGIWIQGYMFPHQSALVNMTRSELNFALLIEETLTHIKKPEYRQIIVELLCIVSTILHRNPELVFQEPLNLDNLVRQAFEMYCKDNCENLDQDINVFIAKKQSITTSYLARAVVNNVLKTSKLETSLLDEKQTNDDYCNIS